MAIFLNKRAYAHAARVVEHSEFVNDDRDERSEHRPSAEQENEFISRHGIDEYARWYLGIDNKHGEATKARYTFPYGDFQRVQRCGVLAAEVRAGQQKYFDIEVAVALLCGMLEATEQS